MSRHAARKLDSRFRSGFALRSAPAAQESRLHSDCHSGLGANTAIFTLIDAVMLKSLPVTKPSELYRLGDDDNCCVVSGLQGDFSIFSYALYEQLRDHTPEFSELAAFQAQPQPFGLRRA